MFDPLVALLQPSYRMLIPDLRGHGGSADLGGPYDAATMARDVLALMDETGFARGLVLGYSHGGTVAQEIVRMRPDAVKGLLLACTYACNVMTLRERFEAYVLFTLLCLVHPHTLAKAIVRASRHPNGMSPDEASWLRDIMGENRKQQMRGVVRDGLLGFDSRDWLKDIAVPTLVIGGTRDAAVPFHHYRTLIESIPGARGCMINRAGHTLLWTHTDELARIVRVANGTPDAPAPCDFPARPRNVSM